LLIVLFGGFAPPAAWQTSAVFFMVLIQSKHQQILHFDFEFSPFVYFQKLHFLIELTVMFVYCHNFHWLELKASKKINGLLIVIKYLFFGIVSFPYLFYLCTK